MSENMQYLSFCVWLVSLHRMSSGPVCLLQMIEYTGWQHFNGHSYFDNATHNQV